MLQEAKKYVRFEYDGQVACGLVRGDKVVVLEGDLFTNYKVTGTTYNTADVRLLAPCVPSKAVCVGLNYKRHAAELEMKLPEEPVIFIKPVTTLINPGDEIIYWPTIGQLDYEGEITVVIGKECHQVSKEAAMDYVFGYTIANDVTARDLQRKDGQWTRAKCFDTFMPMGPYLVTGIDPSDLALKTSVNGVVKQDGRTSSLIFDIPHLVSFISQVMTLYPGDVILTGTPEGIGPMQVGDTVEVEIEGLGRLTNTIGAPRKSSF